MLIDVITLTYNNFTDLMSTIQSMSKAISHIGNIYIIYDGERPDISKMNLNVEVLEKLQLKQGPGKGIYPAMNHALSLVKNNFIFINSGDQLVGNPFKEVVDLDMPISFSCMGQRGDGYRQPIKLNRMIFKFNHNSIVFPQTFKCKYNEKFSIAADYEIIIKLRQKYGYPKFIKTNGYLLYDMSGVSSVKKTSRDLEYYMISKQHNLHGHMIFYYFKYLLNKFRGFD